MKKLFASVLLCLTADLWPLTSGAQAPSLINYQGRLLNGTNLVNGNVGLSLRLFDASASGTKIYEDSNSVTVADGLYSTFIGDNTVSGSLVGALTNAQVWVEVAVNGVALAPRERLASVGYSLATRGISVDAGSNVGIGTATPVSRLTLGGETAQYPMAMTIQPTAHATSRRAGLSLDNWQLVQDITGGGTKDFAIYDAGSGAQRFVIATNGNTGIGTISPTQRLQVVGNVVVTGTVSAANFVGGLNAASLTGTVSDANLSTNVARLSGTNQTFSGPVVFSSASNTFAGTFSGNGAGVTNVSLGTITDPGVIGWGNFVLNASPGVGLNPYSVAAADVNGDGKVDLISANYGPDTLSVLTNNGSGGFTLSSSPGVGIRPYSVVAADVNGDGKVDLISANANDYTLSVLTNNGSGGFTLSSSPGVGSNPYSVVAADVNGDGKMDLISANYGANTLSVLTNNGSGVFTLSSSPGVGQNPVSVAAADVNGDGKVDLISANLNAATLSVLTNNGSGGFTLSSSPGVGSAPFFVAAADVNGDGRVDLISANNDADTLSVLTNNGSGGFTLSSSPGVGFNPRSVAAADVNGDGKVDLISANVSANTLSVLTNNGSGGFTLASSPGVGSGPVSVAAADVNGDGKVDLISGNYNASTLSVLLNTPVFTGKFTGDGSGLTGITNFVKKVGDTMTGPLNLPAGGLAVGTSQLAVTAAGDVGIGTTNPAARLDVNGSGWFRSDSGSLPASAGVGIRIKHEASSGGGEIFAYNYGTASPTNLILQSPGGNVGIGTPTPTSKLQVGVNGAWCNGLLWQDVSDVNLKENFAPVDFDDILNRISAMPVLYWNYKGDREGVRHIGPMAQDFHRAFHVGDNDTSLSGVDRSGVALAAIQALNAEVRGQKSEVGRLQKENAELKKQNDEIMQRLRALETK